MTHSNPFSCFLVGDESLVVRCGEALIADGHFVRGVVSAEPQILAWAAANGVACADPEAIEATLRDAGPFDYLFSITNLRMLPAAVLATPTRLSINFHDGPLPLFAGLHATTWALLEGVSRYAVTWHVMEPSADTGDVLKQRWFEVAPDETALTLNSKCYEGALASFTELVGELASGTERRVPQELGSRSYFGRFKRPEAAAILRFDRPAEATATLVRALDFGPYPNPLALPKVVTEVGAVAVGQASLSSRRTGELPGTLLNVDDSGMTVATATCDLVLSGFTSLEGEPLTVAQAAAKLAVAAGSRVPVLSDELADSLTACVERSARHDRHWRTLLANPRPVVVPGVLPIPGANASAIEPLPGTLSPLAIAASQSSPCDGTAAAFALFLGRVSGHAEVDVWQFDQEFETHPAAHRHVLSRSVPVRVSADPQATGAQALHAAGEAFQCARELPPFPRDLLGRLSGLRGPSSLVGRVGLAVCGDPAALEPEAGFDLVLALDSDAARHVWWFDPDRLSCSSVASLQTQFETFAAQISDQPDKPWKSLSLVSAEERELLVHRWNDTGLPFPAHELLHESFEAQVNETPDVLAVRCGDSEVTYRELNEQANRLAHYLRTRGVRDDVLVGVSMSRSIEMVVAILGIHKAGGAYLPLDPEYPAERIRYMLEDSSAALVLTDEANQGLVSGGGASTFRIDANRPSLREFPATNPNFKLTGSNLAYVIYTSGSTGKPKGVQVEHRNVQNFFTGMDGRIGRDEAGAWLAVTSLSFDISVLELLWTLTRGFTVVLYTGGAPGLVATPASARETRALAFSLFFFASGEGGGEAGAYDLLLSAAKFADANGFEAVWTPERHFHAFGGTFPNPSVTSAAIAAVTTQVQIRAGSCVLPLHSSIRVAEEWAVVDNISGGRVGISFAAGWQPDDFVLQPENFANAKDVMIREVETVKRLWRGESVDFPGHDGRSVPVRTLPRPIRSELPVWLTAAGNPETFRIAGQMGANILTHLLGQSLPDVAERIGLYRTAWREAGHPGEGRVTLMLHTFVGRDDEEVKTTVREPMIEYLRSSVGLIKQFAWSFPAFKNRPAPTNDTSDFFASLSEAELRSLLEYAFERYYETSGLFGTPGRCAQTIESLRSIGVDEVGCLVDFGVPRAAVLEGLELLNEVRLAAQHPVGQPVETVADLIGRNGITHLQCTPSMAGILISDPVTRQALSQLECLMVGGEAMPVSLAAGLRSAMRGRILNMYGPTETTIWSTTHTVDRACDPVPIGTPIANTTVYLLDEDRNLVPPGAAGELYIGGAGVVRGYLNRPELTASRFVLDPFAEGPGARMYRTGDLARHQPDGTIEFLGRIDNQVKIRGHRVEMGEIESAIASFHSVREAVVVALPDESGDQRIVAYVVLEQGSRLEAASLREHLAAELPAFMLPSSFVVLDAFPQTPNAKVDRKALPPPDSLSPVAAANVVPAQGPTEERVAGIWRDILGAAEVDRRTTFFDLGGNSLLLVKVHRRLVNELTPTIALTDLFRFPTVQSLSAFLDVPPGGKANAGDSRAEARRGAMMTRRRPPAVTANDRRP